MIRMIWVASFMFFSSMLFATTTICNGQYALCAYAKCIPIPGEKNKVLCTCDVKSGYSIGSQACQEKPKVVMENYTSLQSRYFPVKKYTVCKNKRMWADCYNSSCLVNPKTPTKASCTCTTAQDKGDYMYATDACDEKGCETGIISSFLIKSATKDLDNLKKIKNFDKLPKYTPQICSAVDPT